MSDVVLAVAGVALFWLVVVGVIEWAFGAGREVSTGSPGNGARVIVDHDGRRLRVIEVREWQLGQEEGGALRVVVEHVAAPPPTGRQIPNVQRLVLSRAEAATLRRALDDLLALDA